MSSLFQFGPFPLDSRARRLSRAGTTIPLQPRVFDTLHLLLRNNDRVVGKEELLDTVWKGRVVTDNALARVISALRRALEDSPRESRYIRAIPRVGYRFVGDVTATEAATGEPASLTALAVLPFTPLQGGGADQALEYGLADTLSSRLSNLRGLVVRPFNHGLPAEAAVSPMDTGRRLGADYCLCGSVQRSRDQIRVTATLMAIRDGSSLWSASFDQRLADIFEVQDAICERILREIAPRLRKRIPHAAETNVEAYRAFLEGRLFLGRHTPGDTRLALERFEAALDADPAYAPAWAGIADCHDSLGTLGEDPQTHFEAARRAAARALALDPDLPEALCVLAKVAWQYEWDWAKAERLFEQALQSYPNRADLHIAYSDFCCYMRYGDRAIEHAEKAMAVDPVSPWVSSLMAQACYMHDRNEEAIEHARRTLELAPGFPFAHFFHGMALMRRGEADAAIEEIERAAASGRGDFFAVLGNWYALTGRRAEAEQILAAMQAAETPAPPIAFVGLHLGLGNLDEAREAFRRSIDAHDWHILILHADPLMIEAARGTDLPELLEPLNLPEDRA